MSAQRGNGEDPLPGVVLRRPFPDFPRLSPRASWEEMAHAYANVVSELAPKFREQDVELQETRAAALLASAASVRTEDAAKALSVEVRRLADIVEKLEIRIAPGGEVDQLAVHRAQTASAHAIEQAASGFAHKVIEKIESEEGGRGNLTVAQAEALYKEQRQKERLAELEAHDLERRELAKDIAKERRQMRASLVVGVLLALFGLVLTAVNMRATSAPHSTTGAHP